MRNNIALDTFKQIIKAGVIMGQANPNKNINELVNVVAELTIKEFMKDT